jgi:DNA-binding transcriptional MerR regulator
MDYKVSELAEKAGVTKRTIHYYISKGLLFPPKGSGVNSLYTDEHLERILLIKKLQESFMPLSKIRDYLNENPKGGESIKEYVIEKEVEIPQVNLESEEMGKVYYRENVCGVFEMHYTKESYEKNKFIIENVKKYVEKLMEG